MNWGFLRAKSPACAGELLKCLSILCENGEIANVTKPVSAEEKEPSYISELNAFDSKRFELLQVSCELTAHSNVRTIHRWDGALVKNSLQILVSFRFVASHNLGLAKVDGYTLLPNDDPLLLGKKDLFAKSTALHRFSFVYSVGEKKLGTEVFKLPCKHDVTKPSLQLLGITIAGQELLVVSCVQCEDIKLVDMLGGKVQVAFSDSSVCWPRTMCRGESRKIWVHSSQRKVHDKPFLYPVMEMDCSTREFRPTKAKMIESRMASSHSMCYLSKLKALALSNEHSAEISVFSCDTGNPLWKIAEIGRGIVDSPAMGLLFVGNEHQLLILDPSTGHPTQEPVPLPSEIKDGLASIEHVFVSLRRIVLFTHHKQLYSYRMSFLEIKKDALP